MDEDEEVGRKDRSRKMRDRLFPLVTEYPFARGQLLLKSR